MPLAALALLLTAAFAHASWNFLAKGARNDLAFQFAQVAVASLFFLPLAIASYVITRPGIEPADAVFIIVSACLHIAYYVLLTQGYRRGDLSLVYPLARGTGPMLVVIGAIVIFGESPSALALAGAAMITGGILVMSWPREAGASREVRVSVAFALSTGACIAVYTLWDKEGVSRLTPIMYGYGIDAARMLILAPLALATAERRQAVAATFSEQRTGVIGIGILSQGAYVMVLAALTLAPVSYVAPAREISILFGALMGLRLLNEPDAPRRLVGAGAIVAGIFALALG